MARSKTPKSKQNISTSKTPKYAQNPDDRRKDKIVWKFGRMVKDRERKWNWCQLDSQKLLHNVFSKLAGFETMTFHELNQTTGCHSILIEQFKNPDVYKELDAINLSDIPALFSLRLKGELRVFCSFSANEFSLIWLDLNHEVYPSAKH